MAEKIKQKEERVKKVETELEGLRKQELSLLNRIKMGFEEGHEMLSTLDQLSEQNYESKNQMFEFQKQQIEIQNTILGIPKNIDYFQFLFLQLMNSNGQSNLHNNVTPYYS
jgi:hypothetical protein